VAVLIKSVDKNSYAQKAGVLSGETLVSINGHEINDVLDYRFYETNRECILTVLARDGKQREVKIIKREYDSIGLEFETYLMDKQHSCRNKCIFCFIDQLPKGMRESLYFKDDDSRMSFLFGNYMTMTNLTDRDIDRIIEMHISPVNISVHTTNPELRYKMMKNPNAGESLKYIEKLANAGIKLNCQLVLCPGVNDGKELERSLNDLARFYPAVESVACVPVGVTKYRQNLYPMTEYNKETAGKVIDTVEYFGSMMLEGYGTRLFYASDEFYLKAERPIPSEEFYEDFSQLENGVGMIALLTSEFNYALEDEQGDELERNLSIATGEAAYPFILKLVEKSKEKWHNLNCNVFKIKNDFFGRSITVAGLITATDLLAQLEGKNLGDRLLIPTCMLRSEGDMFLDSILLEEVEKKLNVPVVTVTNDGYELLSAILGGN